MEESKREEVKKEERKEETKKNHVKKWLENKYNLGFVAILVFSAVLLLYYFSITSQQPLWWDEAEYMSIAKAWSSDLKYDIDPARPPLFSFFASLLMRLGMTETMIKFFIVLLPAFLAIFFTYFLVKEMYDKKVALLATFITSVSWIHIFYAMRMMTDSIGLLFGILAFYFFWKGYVNNKGKKYIWFTGIFIALSFLIRLTGILYGVILVLFLFLTERFKPLKNKNLWLLILFFILFISPYFLWSQSNFGTPLAFRKGYTGPGNNPPGWYMIRHVYDYPERIFFIFFLIGLLTLIPMFLTLDKLLLKKDKTYYNNFFVFLLVIFILFFFIYFLRLAENRWLIAMSLSIFIISAKGILLAYKFISKNAGKIIAVTVLVIILFLGAYYQLKHADMIIQIKKDSYLPVKEAGLWIKQNSEKDDVVMAISQPQITYYSERETARFDSWTEQQFEEFLKEKNPKYLVASIFEKQHPDWSYNPPEKYQSFMKPVRIWFADQEQKQPILIIWQLR